MTEHDRDDDLWDRSGEPDAELRALERALRPHRWQGPTPTLTPRDAAELATAPARVTRHDGTRPADAVGNAPHTDDASLGRRALIAALVLLAVGLGLRSVAFPEPLRYAVEWRGADGVARRRALGPGDALVAPASGSAEIDVGDIGWLELEAGGRLRVASNSERGRSDAEHLVHLERGTLRASIFAAPRVFQVGTPGGLAVDLGCIYTTEVLPEGRTRLHVDTGQVSFESAARQVTVPAGASLVARPGRGPGTPAWDDADADYRALLARVDAGAADSGDLDALLRHPDTRDGLSLAHVLDVAPDAWRPALVERLGQLEPPDDGHWPARVLDGDRDALRAWKRAMSWSW